MTEIIHGIRGGTKGAGREYKVAADQYFQRRGGKFVTIAAGKISLCASNNRGAGVLGWANTPKDTAGQDYWKSSSTDGKDKVFVYTDLDMIYEMPYSSSTGLDASLLGRGLDIAATPLTSAVQSAYIGKVASPIVCVGIDKSASTVYVKIKPANKVMG